MVGGRHQKCERAFQCITSSTLCTTLLLFFFIFTSFFNTLIIFVISNLFYYILPLFYSIHHYILRILVCNICHPLEYRRHDIRCRSSRPTGRSTDAPIKSHDLLKIPSFRGLTSSTSRSEVTVLRTKYRCMHIVL